VVSEDRPEQDAQDQADGTESSPRPATAAARRERRVAGTTSPGSASRPESKRPETKRTEKGYDPKGRTTLSGRREERVPAFSRLVRFLREVVAELRKVIWPTRKELVTYTIVVLFFVSFMVASVFVLDIAFAKGVFWLFG
jgi:preprotein translocase subunit SecE